MGWWLGPAADFDAVGPWHLAAVCAAGLLVLAVVEFGLAYSAEGRWAGPSWARQRRSRWRWSAPLGLALVAGLGAHLVRWALVVEHPGPLLGLLLIAAVLVFGTIRQAMRQPSDPEPPTPEFAADQARLMEALAARRAPIRNDAEMRAAVLAVLVDQPDNRAGRLLAWQLALKAGDLSDAAHAIERLEQLGMPERDLAEMRALWALAADDPGQAADALDRRVDLIRRSPRTTPAGQRADFVAILHLAHALLRAERWDRAAETLDSLGRDYETAPFVGPIDRLIVNHMRWRAAQALETAEVARALEQRCRRFAARSVRQAARRQIPQVEDADVPPTIRWWPGAARAALEWWEKNRAR